MAFWKRLFGREKKSFVQPPFWQTDLLNLPFVASGISTEERLDNDFEGYAQGAYKRNGTIFSVIDARMKLFSEGTFIWRDRINKGNLFGSPELSILETPWPGGTTGELLARMEQDASLAGNSYWTRTDDLGRYGKAAAGQGLRLTRLRPDWVIILIGSSLASNKDPFAADARIIGYMYSTQLSGVPQQDNGQAPTVLLMPDEVCHYSPTPDPVARFRGMSWLTPILLEIQADMSSTLHKKQFFDHAAVPNLAVKFDKDTSKEDFDEFVLQFKAGHQGAFNAYKTLFLLGGADVTPLTMDFRQLDFSATVGKGESRIASAGGMPPQWVGFSEGLQGSGLNAGNYAAARRRLADGTIRTLWRIAAASLQNVVNAPNSQAALWYDTSDVAFLREDETDLAEIFRIQANSIDSLIKSGYKPDASVQATMTRDLGLLTGQHTGLVSVQMQPPLSELPPKSANGQDPTSPGNGPNGN